METFGAMNGQVTDHTRAWAPYLRLMNRFIYSKSRRFPKINHPFQSQKKSSTLRFYAKIPNTKRFTSVDVWLTTSRKKKGEKKEQKKVINAQINE